MTLKQDIARRSLIAAFAVIAVVSLIAEVRTQVTMGAPIPEVKFLGWQDEEWQGRTLRHYWIEVINRNDYPSELFSLSPDLPACGRNNNASRTWVNIHDGRDGRRMYGYCAIDNVSGLAKMAFSLPPTAAPPAKIYIDLVDRRTGTVYRSKKVKIIP